METMQVRTTHRPLSEVLAYSNDRLISRHRRDHDLTEDIAQRRFTGLKQFMAVAAMNPGRQVASPMIDDMWHSFLLYSRDYRSFCEEYLGRRIDHDPFELESATPWIYPQTRALAVKLFGALDPEIWPVNGKADCSSGCE